MKKQIFILLISLFLGFEVHSQAATSGTLLTSSPKECETIKYLVSWQYFCTNHTYLNITYSISGSTLTMHINYSGGLVCAGIIGQKSDTAKLVGVPPGTYTVKVDGNVSGSARTGITLGGNLVVGSCCPVVSEILGDTTTYCIGDTVKLKSSATNSTKDSWFVNSVLMDTNSNFNYVPSTFGIDTITLVTDTTTCSDTSFTSFEVLKDPKLMNDTSVCLTDAIPIRAPIGWNKYLWSDSTKGTSITSRATGTYVVTVTAHSGCMKTDSVKITHVGPKLSLGADTFFCKGQSINIGVDSHWKGVVWNYDIADTNRTKNVDSAGTYVAEVVNSIGCKFTDAIKVAESDTVLNVMSTKAVCKGNSVKLYVAPGNSNLKWSNGSTTDTITVITSGTYSATASNSFGCRTGGSGTAIVNDNPIPQLGNDTSKCNKDNIVLNPGKFKKYKWVFGSTAPVFIVNNAGTYYVEVEDSNSCFGADTIVIASIKCDTTVEDTTKEDTTVFVRTINSQESVKIYPNPANDHLFIKALGSSDLSIGYILDLNGRIVSQIEITSSKINKIDLSLISSGSYLLTLRFEDGVDVRKKLIIE